ncbi:hypothetical protein AB9M90_15450 [Bacillus safensis]|uniref:hypothetical protein n=1 Tax=Bacillus safensis TaxID=561879 RepID=UPI0035115417
MIDLELSLLKMWEEYEIKDIYKYKNRVKAFRGENLSNFELFNDLTHIMFKDIEDIANHRDYIAEDHKASTAMLIRNREQKLNMLK